MLEFLFAVGLAWVNISANDLEQWTLIPQSQWLPFANGVSLTYVFLEILPNLGSLQRQLEGDAWPVISHTDWSIYLPILLGITVFYGMDMLAQQPIQLTAAEQTSASKSKTADRGSLKRPVFWLHIFAFAAYNGILGYLLQSVLARQGFLDCLLFWVVLALHVLLNDASLGDHYQTAYYTLGRWIMAFAVVVGTAVGVAVGGDVRTELSAPAFLWAFVSGSILFSGLAAAARHSDHSFWAFFTGAAIYVSLLLLVATP